MRGRATSTLTAMLGALGLSAAIVLGAAPALADPDPNTAPADPAAAAVHTLDALFLGFPGNSGETVRITVAPEKKQAKRD